MKNIEILNHAVLPVIAAPMFIVSDKDLVTACCKSGIIGTFPALNRRTSEAFEQLVIDIKEDLKAYEETHNTTLPPFGVNLIVHGTNPRVEADLKICVKHKVPIVITSLGAVSDLVDAVHSYGGLVFHDVIKRRHAEKAIEAGVDGLILVCAGAGGHAGTLNPMPFIKEIREIFDGVIILAGSISDGNDVASALQMGADIAYMGTKFIASDESNAVQDYKDMIINSRTNDIIYTSAVSGVKANFMKKSLENKGITEKEWTREGKVDFSESSESEAKAWKNIWSAGQGVTSIKQVKPVSEIVQEMKQEFRSSIARQMENLKRFP